MGTRSIGIEQIGIKRAKAKVGPLSNWSSYWTTLISALINLASPKNIVLTFSKANTSLTASDFTVSENTVNSIIRDATNKIITLVCANNCKGGETVTLTKAVGLTTTALITLPSVNTDLVQWSSIDTIPTTGASYFAATTLGVNKITTYKPERIIGAGNLITQIKLHNITKANITAIIFYIYRFNGTTYDRIYTEDITAKVSANDEVQTITLATPQTLNEGDLVGNRWLSSTGTPNMAAGIVKGGAAPGYWFQGAEAASPVDFASKTASSYINPIYCMGKAPMIVGIGDSIVSAGPLHYGMLDTLNTAVDPSKSWFYKMITLDNRFTYHNCGIGSETTTLIQARFARDVTAKKSKFVVINGGVNDLNTGGSKVTFITKMTAMLDACVVDGTIPIVWKIMPWTAGDNTEMANRDDWNNDLVTLFNTYDIPGKIIIDWDTDLGKFRVGGAAGNLWDIKTEYNQDGVHFNETGQAKIAEVMLREIGEVFDL